MVVDEKIKADKTMDLRGKVCPMTFVYTKIALEKMEPDQILEVIFDFKEAFKNVPKSVKAQKLGEIVAEKEDEEGEEKTFWIKRW
ncbi:MAG: sulfurtransferase TusA family protein [Candidatus Hodarchaeota archaeon]